MTQPDIKLSSTEVREHAKAVDEAARMCDEAVAGAEYIDLHDEVYGVLCSPLFLPLIQPLQDYALAEIRSGADATGHLAELLRSMADNVDLSDTDAARRFQTGT